MATRLHYAFPIARELLLSTLRRLRPGGLAAQLPPPGQRPFVIVTGSGRSGTSAVARVLHESGISMGTEFGPPVDYNATGFYEDVDVRSLNDQISGELGQSQRGWEQVWPWRSTVQAVGRRYSEAMRELAAKGIDGWKDPRFSLTLEAWLPHLPARPKVVVCLRSSEAYLHSVSKIVGLVRRDEIERLWANEIRRLLDVIGDYRLDATCVVYDDLVQRPAETVAGLSEFIGLPLDAQYIEPTLRHHVYPVPRRFAALYDRVRALGPGEQATVQPKRTGWKGTLLARIRGSPPLTSDEARAIDEYVERARTVEDRTAAARDAWAERVGRERPLLAAHQRPNGEPTEVAEDARAASASYVEVLSEAQAELGSQLPPASFERYHESLRSWVDRERLVAQLMLQAVDGGQLDQPRLDAAVDAWERFSSPKASERAQRARSKEHERALRRAGRGRGDG